MLLGLAGDGDRALVVTWPRATQPVRLDLGNDASGRRVIDSIDIETAGSSVYVGFIAVSGLWHRRELRPTDLETDVSLNWMRPFPARWKTQLYEGDVRTTFHFRENRGQIWRGVPGSYRYPAWFEGESAFLHPSKKIPREECLVYFLEGQDTPLGRRPVDILATLAAAADERPTRGRKFRTHHRWGGRASAGPAPAAARDPAVFEAGREVEQKDDIRAALDIRSTRRAAPGFYRRVSPLRRRMIRLRQAGRSSPTWHPPTSWWKSAA
jgi:hypothetical protein